MLANNLPGADRLRPVLAGLVVFACLFAECPALVPSGEPVGLVLSGGGAKGAYEVGVWRALAEAGIVRDVAAISGTSIGSLNAALFASVQAPGDIERVWLDEVDGIVAVNRDFLGQFVPPGERAREMETMNANIAEDLRTEARKRGCRTNELPGEVVAGIEERCASVSLNKLLLLHGRTAAASVFAGFLGDGKADGLLASQRLLDAFRSRIPREWEAALPKVYATALRKKPHGQYEREVFRLDGADADTRMQMICASAAIPIAFESPEVDGSLYVDGGWESKGGDNVPLEPVLEHHPEIRTVIVVYLSDEKHLDGKRRDENRSLAEMHGVRLVEIVPSEDIGRGFGGFLGVFDTSPETARHLIELGRQDAQKVLEKMQP